MTKHKDDEFYVGYASVAPKATGRLVRIVAVALVIAAPLVAATLVSAQGHFDAASFEFGQTRNFTGRIVTQPHPHVLIERPGESGVGDPHSRYLLTVFGKVGADKHVAAFDGQQVDFEGTLIYRDDQTMIELVEGSLRPSMRAQTSQPAVVHRMGTTTVQGMIVGSKCFMGVMVPGHGKVHRGCAARCISSGTPPILAVTDETGGAQYILLIGENGEQINDVLARMAAENVEITGDLEHWGDWFVLKADPNTYRRIT